MTVNQNHLEQVLETRRCWVITDSDQLAYVDEDKKWKGLKSVVKVSYERETGGKEPEESRYYISTIRAGASKLLKVVRGHWGIENSLHWVLDMAFDEDHSRVRSGHADQNLAMVRHMALNMVKQERTAKVGIKARRERAGWDHDYLLKVLAP